MTAEVAVATVPSEAADVFGKPAFRMRSIEDLAVTAALAMMMLVPVVEILLIVQVAEDRARAKRLREVVTDRRVYARVVRRVLAVEVED